MQSLKQDPARAVTKDMASVIAVGPGQSCYNGMRPLLLRLDRARAVAKFECLRGSGISADYILSHQMLPFSTVA